MNICMLLAQLINLSMLAATEYLPVSLGQIISPENKNDPPFPATFVDATNHSAGLFFQSARAALRFALLDAGLGPDDEVLVPGYSCYAVQQAIESVATPVYVDIDESYTIDIDDARACISNRTAAIVPTHLYGIECDMGAIASLASNQDLMIIEDAAQAVSNIILSEQVGAKSDYTFVSFRFYKGITAFKGGLLLSTDLSMTPSTSEDRLKRLRLAGVWVFDELFRQLPGTVYDAVRSNVLDPIARLSSAETDAATPTAVSEWTERILSAQLPQILSRVKKRRQHATVYQERLPESFKLPPEISNNTFFRYPVRVPRARDQFVRYLYRNGIGVSPMYSYTISPEGTCPTSELAAQQIINLPVHSGLSRADVISIADTVTNSWQSLS